MKDAFNVVLEDIRKNSLLDREEPLFIYDEELLEESIQQVFQFLERARIKNDMSRFYFSYKSCPNIFIASKVLNYFYGVDVSSLNEYREIKELGLSPERLSVSGPAKTKAFLETLVKDGVGTIHFDSCDEINEYSRLLKKYSIAPPTHYTVRLNMDQTSSKLGMSMHDLERVLQKMELPFVGVHMYLGREHFSIELLNTAHSTFSKIKSKYPGIKDFYFGPGLSAELMKTTLNLSVEIDPSIQWHFEMGRAVVDNCGFYLAKVLSVKNKNQENMDIVINGGIQHYQSAFTDLKRISQHQTWTIDQLMEIKNGKMEANVFGSLCLSNDLFAWLDNCPNELSRGWWICFSPCGAYNISASPNDFINQDRPVVFWHSKSRELTKI